MDRAIAFLNGSAANGPEESPLSLVSVLETILSLPPTPNAALSVALVGRLERSTDGEERRLLLRGLLAFTPPEAVLSSELMVVAALEAPDEELREAVAALYSSALAGARKKGQAIGKPSAEVLGALARCLLDESSAVAVQATASLVAVASEGLEHLSAILSAWNPVTVRAEADETLFLRSLDLTIRLASIPGRFEDVAASGLLDRALARTRETLSSVDILAALAVTEVVGGLAATERGAAYLEDKGVLGDLAAVAASPDSFSLLRKLVFGVAVRAAAHPGFAARLGPMMAPAILVSLGASDPEDIEAGLSSFAVFGASVGAENLLPVSRGFMQHFASPNPALALASLRSLASLIRGHPEVAMGLVDRDVGSRVTRYATGPYPDTRFGALETIIELVRVPWGLAVLPAHLAPFLLDRATETVQDGWLKKYEICKFLAELPPDHVQAWAGKEAQEGFQEYAKQGPYYSKAGSVPVSVKTEGQ